MQAQSPRPKVQSRFADEVIREGVKFLANSIRPDGSWPIDTNLATWNTTLSINALAGAGEDVAELLGKRCLDWLLSCQHTKPHPFTGADPGGFGWSDLSGAVPDADDTPGAMLAMNNWKASTRISLAEQQRIDNAQMQAANWLLSLRNRDYGWPTFCRGWGKLPFDRSGSDLTAHVLRALDIDSVNNVGNSFGERYDWTYYLRKHVHPDGSWSPLWFGNQDHPDEDNPVYGTARVLMAYRDLELMDSPEAQRGVAWLVANQNDDGGWGSGVWGKIQNSEFRMQNGKVMGDLNVIDAASFAGESGAKYSVLSTQYTVPGTHAELPMPPSPPIRNPQSEIRNLKSSLEETALAVEALLAALPLSPEARFPHASPATSHQPLATSISRGLAWLVARVEHNQHRQAAPIGFYFAKLWYYERLYPLIFTTAALGRACRQYAAPAAGSPAKTPRIT